MRLLFAACLTLASTLAPTAAAHGRPVSEVLAPVAGPGWVHNQHKTGFHHRSGGILGSDDTFAWDSNQNAPAWNGDRHRLVFPVAPGTVVHWGGTSYGIGGSVGYVLVEHQSGGQTWWSGYLHLAEEHVRIGQEVTVETPLGRVGRVGATNDHLHFVLYTGRNAAGGLVSFDARLRERTPTLLTARQTLRAPSLRAAWRGLEAEQVEEYELSLTRRSTGQVTERRTVPGALSEGRTRARYELLLGASAFPAAGAYVLGVRARYPAGWTGWSFVDVTFAPSTPTSSAPSGPPARPTDLSPDRWATSDGTLRWRGGANTRRYLVAVWRWEGRWRLVAQDRTPAARFTLPPAARAAGFYAFAVRAEGPGGASPFALAGFRR